MHQAWKSVQLRGASHRMATVALGISAATCLVLLGARLLHSVSFTHPLQLTTSGAEEDALASIWRFLHGQAVFTDPHVMPYTGSYFNWLFYGGYGSVAGGALRLFGLGEAWLPTVCRMITLAIAVSGLAIFAGAVREAVRLSWPTACLFGALALFNPLSGFWVFTTRPDVGAAVLELGAVAAFLRYRRTKRWMDLLLIALLLGGAWAFKQTAWGRWRGLCSR